ncbi:MAG: 5-formyltetrahydrofolate cyclo-ligase [Candidatus Kapaibacterium sp.]|nr:MAG: 5-formyltetrahydrofolate cyclo-ligase [Candidatus Kapabacteria bacterium]
MTKSKIRTALKVARQALSEAERHEKSKHIAERLFCTQEWQQAATLHSYCSFGTEVATERIIARAWAEGKNVCVPVIEPTTHEMLSLHVQPETRFVPDSFGIPTPQFSQPDKAQSLENILLKSASISASILDSQTIRASQAVCVLVPLLGFDVECYRIGYGKGHYDRFFAGFSEALLRNTVKIGCAFQCQCVAELPRETHDIPLDMIITEESIYRAW